MTIEELRAAEMIDVIVDLLATRHYDWARETLEGILGVLQSTGRCSIRQQEAVEHIIVGRLKHDAR